MHFPLGKDQLKERISDSLTLYIEKRGYSVYSYRLLILVSTYPKIKYRLYKQAKKKLLFHHSQIKYT